MSVAVLGGYLTILNVWQYQCCVEGRGLSELMCQSLAMHQTSVEVEDIMISFSLSQSNG